VEITGFPHLLEISCFKTLFPNFSISQTNSTPLDFQERAVFLRRMQKIAVYKSNNHQDMKSLHRQQQKMPALNDFNTKDFQVVIEKFKDQDI